jgi:outer membrane protein OmpA-like peptidoglycan-associated protein
MKKMTTLFTFLSTIIFFSPTYAQNTLDKVQVKEQMDIYFGAGKFDLDRETVPQLQKVARLYQNNPLVTVLITAYIDDQGNSQSNFGLADRRAFAIKNFLLSEGVSTNALLISTYSPTENDADMGRKSNQRATVGVYEPTPEKMRMIERERELIAKREREAIAEKEHELLAIKEREAAAERERQLVAKREREAIAEKERELLAIKQREAAAEREREAIARREREAIAAKERELMARKEKGTGTVARRETITEKTYIPTENTERTVERVVEKSAPVVTVESKGIEDNRPYLQGIIRNSETNEPVKAQIFVTHQNGKVDSAYTDNNGAYKLPAMMNEEVVIDVFAKGYFYASQDVVVERNLAQKIEVQPVRVGNIATITNVYFVGDEATLLKSSDKEMAKILRFMRLNRGITIEIGGHVNAPGVEPKKLPKVEFDLSTNRAKTIRSFLMNNGFAENKIMARGYGNSKMRYPDPTTDQQEQLNRRVEIKILDSNQGE